MSSSICLMTAPSLLPSARASASVSSLARFDFSSSRVWLYDVRSSHLSSRDSVGMEANYDKEAVPTEWLFAN